MFNFINHIKVTLDTSITYKSLNLNFLYFGMNAIFDDFHVEFFLMRCSF